MSLLLFFTSRNKLNFYELQIGNWSRWITELVGSGGANSVDDETRADNDDDGSEYDFSSESFHLLNALSDLMLLPKDMLLSRTIRKEVHLKTLKLSCLLPIVHISFSLLMNITLQVCPTFGPIIIRRVLNVFVPDEFCPDPIHEVVLEALNSEVSSYRLWLCSFSTLEFGFLLLQYIQPKSCLQFSLVRILLMPKKILS